MSTASEFERPAFPLGKGSVTATTRNGKLVVIRHIAASDEALLLDLFYQLSERTRRLRFLRPVEHLPEEHIRRMTQQLAQIDPRIHAALIATVEEQDRQRAVAVARLAREADDPQVAELAVVVRDDYQGQGLGTIIADLLVQVAMVRGIRRMVGYTLAENRGALALVHKLGLPVRSTTQQGEAILEIELLDGER